MTLNNRYVKILLIFLSLMILNKCVYSSSFLWSSNMETIETSVTDEIKTGNFLNLESTSAILIEQNSGEILYEHNIHEQLRPASVTKLMTILLIMEEIDSGKLTYDTKIPCSEKASSMGGSQIWLNTTETLTVNEMLKAICIVSANDCAVAMAEYIGGTEENFVKMMNDKAKSLGMNDTCFKNCHGLDEDGHLTSSYDIALMSRELLNNHPDIKNYTTIFMDTLRDGKSELVNTNKLIRNYKGATGLKTGSTSLALFNLSASATREDLSLIAVVMKAPTTKIRFSEAEKLLNYGFSEFSYIKLGNEGDIINKVTVNKGTNVSVGATIENTSGCLIKKGQESSITQSINLSSNIEAPIKKGDKIGEVTYLIGENVINRVNLISDSDVERLNLLNMYKNVFNKLIGK